MLTNINTKSDNVVIDKIDEKILQSLIINSRAPLSMLSKNAKISKQGCFYRLKRLEAENIITGYRVKINSAKLGYSSFCLYVKLVNITESSENELIEKIILKNYVRWFVTCTGRWDIMVSFSAKDNLEYNNRMKELLKLMEDKVLHYETSIILSTNDLWLRDRTLLKSDLIESDSKEKVTIDEKDKKILNMLQKNARIEVTKIAPEVNLTAEAVSYRIKRLQKDNIIHSFTVSINKEKFGLNISVRQVNINKMAVRNSTSGYCQEIFCRQWRQRPPKIMKLSSGILSYQAIILRHLGQYDRPIRLSSLYKRHVKQFRKEPMTRPIRMTKNVNINL